MSERRVFFLVHPQARANAIVAVKQAPDGYCVELKQPTRSLEQNAKMWAMLADVAAQVEWHGQQLTSENWKDIFTAALKRQAVVPGIDGGFVVLGTSTRRMTKGEMSELVELMYAFGAEHGVVWTDPMEAAA